MSELRQSRGPNRLTVHISTDGTARNSTARVERDDEGEDARRDRIVQASCSVRTEPTSGIRIITATVWERI